VAHPDPEQLRAHIEAGYDLLPLHRHEYIDKKGRKRGKSPKDDHWRVADYASQDPRAWMRAGYNVGVRLRDDQLVIDVDPRNFNSADVLERFKMDFVPDLDRFPRVDTGSGGYHYYMKKPAGLRVRDTLKEQYPGVEFKTFGRQVVAAGSVHPDTKRIYRADITGLINPPDAPQKLLDAIKRGRDAGEEVEAGAACAAPGEIDEGALRKLLDAITPGKYRDNSVWELLMMSAHYVTAGEGIDAFVEWSTSDPMYADHEEQIRARWNSLRTEIDGRSIASGPLIAALKEAGRIDALAQVQRRIDLNEFPDDLPALVYLPRKRRFAEYGLDELSRIEQPKWLVDGLLPENCLACSTASRKRARPSSHSRSRCASRPEGTSSAAQSSQAARPTSPGRAAKGGYAIAQRHGSPRTGSTRRPRVTGSSWRKGST